ncbi:hypothetical protein NP493_89g05021 [Ridgeia piscesae]|uniref:Reverse transcriptase domain-containing protein n=1 Tax=Ridgeia piscesae TaxID=27915 RepID=A0AAD9P890_RIDPI|nr:hypothetical protein NP493_89g05021 [Ridgeia piscesae]
MLLVDFSSAFDKINHNILIRRLSLRYGFVGKTLDWMISYLKERTQRVVIGDQSSSTTTLTRGVPQGSVLGPLLFSLYVQPIGDIIRAHGLSINMPMIYTHLDMKKQVSQTTSAYSFYLRNINHISRLLPRPTKERVVNAIITSRLDNCNALLYVPPLDDVIIDVSKSEDGVSSQRCASIKSDLLLGETRHIHCVEGVKGRFVNITVPGSKKTLRLCRVQVYGTAGYASESFPSILGTDVTGTAVSSEVMEHWRFAMLVLVDTIAAFDTIKIDILLNTLVSRYNFGGTALDWFRSYLTGRSRNVNRDVFNARKNVSATASKKFGLKINVKKSEVLYKPNSTRAREEDIMVDGNKLNSVLEFNYIGSTITSNGCIDDEIQRRMAKVRIKEQNNSLFKNGLSKNTADVKLRRSTKHITPQKLCGNVAECRHDYKATGNIEVARASVYANATFMKASQSAVFDCGANNPCSTIQRAWSISVFRYKDINKYVKCIGATHCTVETCPGSERYLQALGRCL